MKSAKLVKNEEETFMLASSTVNDAFLEQHGRQIRIRRSEAILMNNAAPRCCSSPADLGEPGVNMSWAKFDARGVHLHDTVLRRLTPQNEALHLLRAYVKAVEKSGLDLNRAQSAGMPTALHETVQQHIHDLMALAVSWQGAAGKSSLSAAADARLQAALDYIAAHFDDPRLTIEKVARHQGISPRYLQRLMETSGGRSYTAVVNEMRLQKAFAALTAAEQTGRTVLDIAMQAGFVDISHFNRLFRARFGATPTSIRAQAKEKAN